MRVNKRAALVAVLVQLFFCLSVIVPALFLMSGCTMVINSENVVVPSEVNNAVMGMLTPGL